MHRSNSGWVIAPSLPWAWNRRSRDKSKNKLKKNLNLSRFTEQYISMSMFFSCFEFTHLVILAVVVAWVWIEGTQLHPAKTHLIFSLIKKPTYVCPGLTKRNRQKKKKKCQCICVYLCQSTEMDGKMRSKVQATKTAKSITGPGITLLWYQASCVWGVLEQDTTRVRDAVYLTLWPV